MTHGPPMLQASPSSRMPTTPLPAVTPSTTSFLSQSTAEMAFPQSNDSSQAPSSTQSPPAPCPGAVPTPPVCTGSPHLPGTAPPPPTPASCFPNSQQYPPQVTPSPPTARAAGPHTATSVPTQIPTTHFPVSNQQGQFPATTDVSRMAPPQANSCNSLPSRPAGGYPTGYVQNPNAADRHMHGVVNAGSEEGLLAKLGRWVEGMNERFVEVGGKTDGADKN